ncbi:S8 family serine peptidase [uncultured Meiothermus sp.]|jgi:subtilisin family serine protease|uniref:S8 family peptidase n=1 Tax=uncultured Meiothermus sp. TaxID=157471 RepID=UPI00261DA6CB|nr:S8 family serine peptidase [uncultured Meiothermus sp.]
MMLRFLLALLLLIPLAPFTLAQSRMVEVIVELEGPQLPRGQARAELMRLLKAHLSQMQGRLRTKAAEGFWASQSFLVRLPESQVGRLAQVPGVRRVYPNRAVSMTQPVASALSVPVNSGSNWALQSIGAPSLWIRGMRGQGVRIGHLDTGVDASHPDLRGKIAAFAVVNANGTPRQSEPYDSSLHGTHTAGLLVGNNFGVAPEARLVSALVLPNGYGTLAQVLGGLDWVLEQNVQVVSMSLGLEGTWTEFAPVVERMKQMGVLPVFAIGNSGSTTASPGNMPDALGIGATNQANQVAGFSSRGEVRWGTPYNVVLSKPDLVAPGVDVLSTIPGGRYMAMSGTSVSTAIAAGSAALLISGGFKAEQVRQALLGSAQNIQAAGSGRGIIRLGEALAVLRPPDNPQATQPTPPDPQSLQPNQPSQVNNPQPEGKTALLVIETSGAAGARRALDSLGFRTEVMQIKPEQRPGADKVDDFALVIWVLPTNWSDTWPESHRKMLRAYVEQGGRLMLITNIQNQRPVTESSAYGKGKASFVSGDLGNLTVERRAQVFQGVIQHLMR